MNKIIRKYIKQIIIIFLFLLIFDFLLTLPPFIIKQVVDIDFNREDIDRVIVILICLYILVHFIRLVFKYIQDRFINKTICNFLKDVREVLFNKILSFKMVTFHKYNSSELYTRLTDDVDNLFDLFFGFLYDILFNILYIIFMVIMMFIANINLAVIGAVIIFLISILVYKFTKILGNLDNEIMKKRDLQNIEYSEIYNKNKLTYLFQLQNKNINKMNDLFYSELKIRKKYLFIHHFPYWIISILQAIGVYLIIYYALNINMVSLGSIYLVLYYIKECKIPLEEICNQLEEMQVCINSYKRIKKLFSETEEENIYDGSFIENLNGDIKFENVSMKYDKDIILKDISLKIKKGSKITIVGKTGAGKTTLVNVLMKLYDIQKGKILIDDKDISKISTKCLRDNISYISQTPYMFTDTIRNNIILGNKNITDEQINNLIEEIGIQNMFKKMPDGLNTMIKSKNLSYGELQIIAFIRAIVHKANFYIFDEPTSNIDLKTEKMMQNIIDKISKNSTVIIIAHRKSTIESSDNIIYLENGKVLNKKDVII